MNDDQGLRRRVGTQTYRRIRSLYAQGSEEEGSLRSDQALATYAQLLELLPQPRKQWKTWTQTTVAIADIWLAKGDLLRARDILQEASEGLSAVGNPYFHLRVGQVCFDLGEMRNADDNLARAFLLGGFDIFEDEEPKYLNHAVAILDPPAGYASWEEVRRSGWRGYGEP